MSLRQLQTRFMDALWTNSNEMEALVRSSDTRSSQDQFATYRGSVIANLVAALGDIYPRVKRALGDEFFDAMARRYVLSFHSGSPSLDRYGAQLPDFCGEFEPLKEYAYVADIARVDWAWHRAFHSVDVKSINVDELQAMGELAMHKALNLHPSAAVVTSSFPLYQLWMLNQDGRHSDCEEPFELNQSAEQVLVWRPEHQVKTMRLDEHQLLFLNAIEKQPSLASAFEHLLAVDPEFQASPEHLSNYLTLFLAEGVFC